MISWFLITTLFNLTDFTIVLVGAGEKLSCIPWARKTLRPNNHKGVRHSFMHSCGEKHGSYDSVFQILIDGYITEITIKSTDILYSMSIVFIYKREEEVILVQGIEEKKGYFKNCVRRFGLGIFRRKNVLDIKGPIFNIRRVDLPPELRETKPVNDDEGPSVLANASIVTAEDSQLEVPPPRGAIHVNDDEGSSVLAKVSIVTAEDSQLEAPPPREAIHVNDDEGPSVLANASIVTDSQLEAPPPREATHVNNDDEGPSVLANDSIVTTKDSQLEATRANGDEGPSLLANASIVVIIEDSQREEAREDIHVNDDEGPYVLANDGEDSQFEAPPTRVIDVDGVTSLVLPVAVVDAPSLSAEEQELDRARKSIIQYFSASVKQWRSYSPSYVQKLNGYHIMFLMMIAALFGYYVGLSGVTLDQIHLIIYNRIEAAMCRV